MKGVLEYTERHLSPLRDHTLAQPYNGSTALDRAGDSETWFLFITRFGGLMHEDEGRKPGMMLSGCYPTPDFVLCFI